MSPKLLFRASDIFSLVTSPIEQDSPTAIVGTPSARLEIAILPEPRTTFDLLI